MHVQNGSAVNTSPELFASASDKTPMCKNKYLSFESGPGSDPLEPLALVIRGISSSDMTIAVDSPPCEYLMVPLLAAEIRLILIEWKQVM
jgi:hypothetical protein